MSDTTPTPTPAFQLNRAKRVKAAFYEYEAQKRAEATAKAAKEAARAVLLEAAGDATTLKVGNQVVATIGTRTTESVSIATLRKIAPQIVREHGKVSTSKVINVTL